MRPKIEKGMNFLFYLLIAVAALGLVGGGIALVVKGGAPGKDEQGPAHQRSARERAVLRREAQRRLEQNDRDWEALLTLADLAYEEGNHLDAFRHYQSLAPLAGANPEIDPFLVNLRLGHSALKLKNPAEAYKSFLVAWNINGEDFEVNYNLGLIEYGRRRLAKAAGYLSTARGQNPDHPGTNRYLGNCLYLLKMYPQAVKALEKALDFEPESRETQYLLARAYHSLNQSGPALDIFLRLRPDPKVGAMACLFAGSIHAQTKRYRQAIEDFELGLRHPGVAAPAVVELKYRLAAACLKEGELSRAVKLWKEILESQPGYKDVEYRLRQYQEINRNRHLRTFIMGPTSEFISLCRKVALRYFPSASTTLSSIDTHRSDFVDIQAHVRTRQSEESVMFRFVRSGGVTGELLLRELHARIKDQRANRGVCVSAGSFTEAAARFVEARMIDLVGRDQLLRLFKGV
jgi:tetratricopeptide (TPR) repeat protein